MGQQHFGKRPKHWESMTKGGKRLFVVGPLIPHLIGIGLIIGAYYLINQYGLFLTWSTYIYYAFKILIAFEILAASARTLIMPILTLIAAGVMIYIQQAYDVQFYTMADAWQLGIVGLVGILVTIIIKL